MSKYYSGPSGIFYDAKNDEIFTVEKRYPKAKWAVLKKGAVVGMDEQWTYNIEYKDRKVTNTLITNMNLKSILLLERKK